MEIPIEQTIILADGEDISPLPLEALLFHLRRTGQAAIKIQGGNVPTAVELAIAVLEQFGVDPDLSDGQIALMNQAMRRSLV